MIVLSAILVLIDQFTKYIATQNLKGADSVTLIEKFVSFTYVENNGAAFGIFQDQRLFFVIMTSVVLVAIIGLFVIKGHSMTRLTKVALHLIVGGAVGNLIDRMRLGYVVDFIYVQLGSIDDFPVFNVADMALVIGTVIVMVLIVTDRYER